jgi:hypothetical protein
MFGVAIGRRRPLEAADEEGDRLRRALGLAGEDCVEHRLVAVRLAKLAEQAAVTAAEDLQTAIENFLDRVVRRPLRSRGVFS